MPCAERVEFLFSFFSFLVIPFDRKYGAVRVGGVRFSYEPKRDARDRKIKHEWDEDHAGFVTDRAGNPEGKCPANIDIEQAEALLNDGIPDSPPEWFKEHPKYFYNIHDGVIYKAVETNPGKSYHAYPCRGPRSRDMTVRMQRKLLDKAQQKNCLRAIQTWFADNP